MSSLTCPIATIRWPTPAPRRTTSARRSVPSAVWRWCRRGSAPWALAHTTVTGPASSVRRPPSLARS